MTPKNWIIEHFFLTVGQKDFDNKIPFLPFQTQTILERHLKIGEGLTTAQLIEMTKEGPVTMLRGAPGFKFVEKVDEVDGSTYTVIEWEDLQARIIRPNMECSNGIIHVIDKVIMKVNSCTLRFVRDHSYIT